MCSFVGTWRVKMTLLFSTDIRRTNRWQRGNVLQWHENTKTRGPTREVGDVCVQRQMDWRGRSSQTEGSRREGTGRLWLLHDPADSGQVPLHPLRLPIQHQGVVQQSRAGVCDVVSLGQISLTGLVGTRTHRCTSLPTSPGVPKAPQSKKNWTMLHPKRLL